MTSAAVLSTPTATLRAALYGRVSHDRNLGRSVSEQEVESRAACALNNWAIEATYSDNDVSASRFTSKVRADWTKLVADLDAGKFDVLVFWEPSRGSRELVTWAVLLDACRRHGVLVHVTSHRHTYDLTNPRDWRSLAEDGVDSAYESEKASQRIRRSMNSSALAGRPHGRVPYGYVRRYDPATKVLVAQEIDPATAPVVREIVKRLAVAEPVSKITDDLNARGVPSPSGKKWSRVVLRKVAMSYTYLGQREYAGEVIEGDWPALVDVEQWYAVRRILLDPKRKVTKPGRYKYLLSYIAQCGVCEAPLGAVQRRSMADGPNAGRSYFCTTGHVSVGIDWLDKLVVKVALERLQDKKLMAKLAGGDDKDVIEARAQVSVLKVRLNEFRDAAAVGELTPASLAHIEARLEVEIETAEKKAISSAVPPVLRELVGAEDVEARWEALPIAGRRKAIQALKLDIKLDRSKTRGRWSLDDFDRVRISD